MCSCVQGTRNTLRIMLDPFSIEQVQEFLQQMLEGVAVTPEFSARIAERTGGLPLYVEQVHPHLQRPLLSVCTVNVRQDCSCSVLIL